MQSIQFKRTNVSGKKPTPEQLQVGEVAINLKDHVIFTKDRDHEVVQISVSPETHAALESKVDANKQELDSTIAVNDRNIHAKVDEIKQTTDATIAANHAEINNKVDVIKRETDATIEANKNKAASDLAGVKAELSDTINANKNAAAVATQELDTRINKKVDDIKSRTDATIASNDKAINDKVDLIKTETDRTIAANKVYAENQLTDTYNNLTGVIAANKQEAADNVAALTRDVEAKNTAIHRKVDENKAQTDAELSRLSGRVEDVANIGQNRGELPVDANLDHYGPRTEFAGIWGKSTSTNAQPSHNFPEENAVGVLEVFTGGQFSCTQRYTTRYGNIYIRSLTATWNGTDGPWSPWRNIQMGTRPLSTTSDLNDFGDVSHFGLWRNSSNAIAALERNFPEAGSAAKGLLEVFEGGSYSRMQRYTTMTGIVYLRSLTATWDAADPKWGPWQQVGNVTPSTFYDGDLNNFKTPGLYNILGTSAVINCPTGEGLPAVIVGLLEVKQRASGGAIFQKFTTAGTGTTTRGRIFERAMTNNIWGAWNEVYTSYSMPITLGIGGVKTQLTDLDWQTFNFVPGAMYSVPLNKMTNMPANMDWGTIDGNLIMLSVGPSEHTGTGRTVQVWRGTVSQANYRYFVVRVAGNPGNRTNTVRRVVVEDGRHTWTAQQDFNGAVNFGGSTVFKSTTTFNTEVKFRSSNAFKMYGGKFGTIFRNDGESLYILSTDEDDQDGNFNTNRPFRYQFKTGDVTLGGTSGADILRLKSSSLAATFGGDVSLSKGTLTFEAGGKQSRDYFRFNHWGDSNKARDNIIQLEDSKGAHFSTERTLATGAIKTKFFGEVESDGRLTIKRPGDAIVLSTTASNALHIRGDVDGNNNWYIGKGGADNSLAFYSYATQAGIHITNNGEIALAPQNFNNVSISKDRIYINATQWVANHSGAWDGQWREEAPIFVDQGSVGEDSYYPLIKGHSQITGQGYSTKVDFGLRRTPQTWGQAVIRVGSAENSPASGHPQGIFEFHANGTSYSPKVKTEALAIGTESIWGSPHLVLGDNDTGLMWGGDGRINLLANGQHIASWGVFHQEHPGLWSVGAGLWTEVDKAIISHGHLIQANDNYSTYVRDIYIRSDIRVKKDLVKFENASQTLSKINGYMYLQKRGLNEDGSERWEPNAGLIAQEVQSILPELVEGDPVGENLLRLNYNGVIGLITAAINEHTEEISLLKEENKLLRDRLAAIEAKLFG
ncbi:pyocin knob domain-containing S74 family peptidase [Escherichia coli]|uniref:pyocin knob domain-containing S74 family peptidase n=1 Tax=Escherichia coli TaxID=562 RepID=UPI00111B0418|nr:pyocin knob domain-containing S74 family peptidase [Escherichia coli]